MYSLVLYYTYSSKDTTYNCKTYRVGSKKKHNGYAIDYILIVYLYPYNTVY